MFTQEQLILAMNLALSEAKKFLGATSPNPAVGAVAINASGRILGFAVHEKAGTAHAEAKLLSQLSRDRKLSEVDTLLVTLEPCNHHGRTPPCTEAIIASGIKNIIYGCHDPNPNVAGRGAERLRAAGLKVSSGLLQEACEELVQAFSFWSLSGRPWLTIKQALRSNGSMVPEPGTKTFTNQASLRLAHEMRRRTDAIITGSGTILADNPLFTVRQVPDFPEKQRWLLILDRRHRVSQEWRDAAQKRNFLLLPTDHPALQSLEAALSFLGKEKCLEVLLEAGPSLTEFALKSGLWNQHVVIQQGNSGEADQIITRSNNSVYGNYRKSRESP